MSASGHIAKGENLHQKGEMPPLADTYRSAAVTLPGHPQGVPVWQITPAHRPVQLTGLRHTAALHSALPAAARRHTPACLEAPPAPGQAQSLSAHPLPAAPALLPQVSSRSSSAGGAAGIRALAEPPQELQRQESGLPPTAIQMTAQQVHSAETR